jgi:hypothetical protein
MVTQHEAPMTDFDDLPASDDVATDAGGGTVELALRLAPPEAWQMVFALVKIAVDPRTTKRNLRALPDSLAATTAAQRQLESDRAALDQHKAKELAEIAAERDVLMKRRLAVHEAEGTLKERFERIGKLEAAWSGLSLPGEPPPLMGTLTRSKPFTGLQVAKYAAEHGHLPDHPLKPLDYPDAPVVAGAEQSDQSRRGTAGEKFPEHVTLTRTPEQPEAAPVGAARIRVGRRGAA